MVHLSNRLNRLAPSATLAMSQKSSEMKAQGIDVINMSVGEPDFNTPDHIKEAAKKAVDDNWSRYSPVPGYPDLRKAVVEKLKRENGLDYSVSEILVSNGAKQAVCNVVMALVDDGDEVIIMKIPGVYAWRKRKAYKQGSCELREDVEYTHSRDSDVIAWNATPILKIAGQLEGDEDKGESRRIFRVENTGDVQYVSWDQSNDANKNHIDRSLSFFWQINQMADISVENMIKLQSIGYDARMTIFIDVFLKIGQESKPLLQAYRREGNVIKAFLKIMTKDKEWKKEVDNVRIKHIITPYIPKDEMQEIEKRLKANGGKPIESHLESIQRYGKSKDPAGTLEQIQKETAEENKSTLSSLFQEGVV